jgi:hypothetical protein
VRLSPAAPATTASRKPAVVQSTPAPTGHAKPGVILRAPEAPSVAAVGTPTASTPPARLTPGDARPLVISSEPLVSDAETSRGAPAAQMPLLVIQTPTAAAPEAAPTRPVESPNAPANAARQPVEIAENPPANLPPGIAAIAPEPPADLPEGTAPAVAEKPRSADPVVQTPTAAAASASTRGDAADRPILPPVTLDAPEAAPGQPLTTQPATTPPAPTSPATVVAIEPAGSPAEAGSPNTTSAVAAPPQVATQPPERKPE